MSGREAAKTFCTSHGLDLVKWDSVEKWEDVKDIIRESEKS